MLLVVSDEIVQSEAVVRSYVIHALVGVISFVAVVGKKIVAAVDATHQVRNHPRIALNETADVIAKPPVPLEPSHAGKSAAELICAGVPRLSDQTEPAQLRIGGDLAEDRRVSPVERSVRIAAEHRRQIETESVDVHLVFPITQAVHHHLAHVSLAEIQRVPRTRVIRVRIRWIGRQHVVAGAVEALIAVDRASVVALAGVVVNNIKHDPDARLMKRLHHVLEFEVLLVVVAVTGILRVRREEVQRHVAPVVALLRIALKNRHQLDNRDPEFLQIRDLFHQSGIRPGARGIDTGVGVLA